MPLTHSYECDELKGIFGRIVLSARIALQQKEKEKKKIRHAQLPEGLAMIS